jgi:hypothetical protein
LRTIQLRWAATCATCGVALAARQPAAWDAGAKAAHCVGHAREGDDATPHPEPAAFPTPPAIDTGVAGASASRQYERRSDTEQRRKEEVVARDAQWRAALIAQRPMLGRVVSAMTLPPSIAPESQPTGAWKVGAEGERRVAEILDACPRVMALHDRAVRGSRANIDHIAVAPSGIYVIDAKKYTGMVESHNRGPLFQPDWRLRVKGRDQTKLVHGVISQVQVVRDAISPDMAGLPIRGVLCFVGAEWPRFFRRPLQIAGVAIVWPDALTDLVTQEEVSAEIPVEQVARELAAALPRAR